MHDRARAVVVALLLVVGAAACGGGSDDDGAGGGSPFAGDANKGGGGSGGSEGDACSLLEVAEIEAEFGDQGAVADGELLGISCSWDVGAIDDEGSGIVAVTKTSSGRGAIDEIRDLSTDPVAVDGLGDEAFFDFGFLWFRSGDHVMSVSAAFFPAVDVAQEKLITLARHMLERV